MHPPAHPHDPLQQLYPGVYWVQGSIRMGPGLRMNRNMVIVQNHNELTLINPVRLSAQGLASLEALGKVTHLLRLGDFHCLDDAFYLERYGCQFWAQPEQSTYPQPTPDHLFTDQIAPPLPDAAFFVFNTATYPEAALLLKQHKLLITVDSVQYHANFRYFSGITRVVFKLLGFKQGINIGGPWRKRVTPKGGSLRADFDSLLALDFDAIVAAHGQPLTAGAKAALRQEVEQVFK
ncbi:hypothetical protein [uncultured Pseudomonas sp.]|uniref:hypothetical protein n=1 Tax=uncultured Pseudomonas sp. TaxID=114707 RepID=UPI0030D7DEBA|tara:strand:+ start:2772 stop:3476 length:705 start_codon:yes stop_codon:yes gene_type:complete